MWLRQTMFDKGVLEHYVLDYFCMKQDDHHYRTVC
jgi:hypothetical protein